MYSDEAVIDLKNKVISKFYFSEDDKFAGFALYDVNTQTEAKVIASDYTFDYEIKTIELEPELLNSY